MRVIVVIGVVVSGLVLMACGRESLAPAEVGTEVETSGLEVDQDYNLQINVPIPDRVMEELTSRPRPRVVASNDTTSAVVVDSAVYVVINNLSKPSMRTVFLAVDLAKATASASVNIEVGATVFQGFYRDGDGIIIYQSGRVVVLIEKGRPYQITIKMKPAAVAPANINVVWDTALVTGEPVIIPPLPPPPPPPTPNLTFKQAFASAYYVFDGRQRLEFFTVFEASAAEDTVELEEMGIKVVGSLNKLQIDTLIVMEKLGENNQLLFKVRGSAVFNAANEATLQLWVAVPKASSRFFLIGCVINQSLDLDSLVNQNIGLSITKVQLGAPAIVATRLPIGQAVPLSFLSETQPILLPRL
ncbi:MAG: hypothetical protein HY454_03305 [Parcubacteria group bacterium]|nr:hypothetical protein [Parcubacteria group bacterium]